jgi:hypothetical protein
MEPVRAWLFGSPRRRPRLFVRRIRISDAALSYVQGPDCDQVARWAFAELLLRLDSNPIEHSDRLATAPAVPGLRWPKFAGRTVILQFVLAEDLIRIVSISE